MVEDHKIYCGDSRNMKEIANESIHLIITSPPYFDLKDYNNNDNHLKENQLGSPKSYQDYIDGLNEVWKECLRVLVPDGKICINVMPVFLSGEETSFGRRVTRTVINDVENFMNSTKIAYLHSLFIWDKRKSSRFSSFGSYPYPPNIFSTFPFEWIIVFSKKGKRIEKVAKEIKDKSKISQKEWADWAINSFWEMSPAKAKKIGHPAPFPEEMPRRLIKLYSFHGNRVLDPFAGSGTTIKVAKELGRIGIGYDINPEYVDIATKRVSQDNL